MLEGLRPDQPKAVNKWINAFVKQLMFLNLRMFLFNPIFTTDFWI